jgi:hypothetical protein
MRKLLMPLLSSAGIGVGVFASTTPAAAFWPLLMPMLIGAGAGGVGAGAAVTAANQPPTATAATAAPKALSGVSQCRSWACPGLGLHLLPSLGERRVDNGPNLPLTSGGG